MSKQYDVVVIGAGPGGLTAALYAARANLSVLIIDRGIYGGQMNNTGDIDNYPGFEKITGAELSEKMYQATMKFGPKFVYGEVEDIKLDGLNRIVKTSDAEYVTRALVIATGAEHKHLKVPGEEAFQGRGVSYCAICDATFFRDEEVTVIGGGDSAIEEGLFLTQLAKKVTIVHRRDKLRANPLLQKKAFSNKKISFVWNAVTKEIEGNDKKVTGITYEDKTTGEVKHLSTAGVFIYVGIEPQTKAFVNLGITDEKGWIITDEVMKTSVPGIFALGDVRKKELRQIATAVGEGSTAGQGAYNYLQSIDN